ncbi:MAG TPA: thioredoxin family protein [Steroidobacteraceae bacterium]|nr:thioredoxin family protein [Steroidobacteraceae bacterium]
MTQSRMLALGTRAPDFRLPDVVSGNKLSLSDIPPGRGLMVAFICNHCPFVKLILDGLVQYAHDYAPRGIASVAISSNDVGSYPEDSPQAMATLARARHFGFPYLYDATQAVAKSYQAVCTPDLFLFDGERKLFYRGQFDGARPRNGVAVTGGDLRSASDALLQGKTVDQQLPSVGCNIKWLSGNEPGPQ